jgi:hypothetical protein
VGLGLKRKTLTSLIYFDTGTEERSQGVSGVLGPQWSKKKLLAIAKQFKKDKIAVYVYRSAPPDWRFQDPLSNEKAWLYPCVDML